MDPERIRLVHRSWRIIVARADFAAKMFYDRLFELDPRARQPFVNTEAGEQERTLMQMLALSINSLSNLSELTSAIEALGTTNRRAR